MAKQKTLDMAVERKLETVERYALEQVPIRGYPELRWNGKKPFRSTQYFPAQLKENHGEPVNGWMNRIYWGDNLQVMSHLLKEFRGKMDLLYIDPPFDSKIDYKKSIKFKGKTGASEYTAFEEKQYTDVWINDEYLQFMYERLILMRELLKDNGVLCLHCDWHKSHYLRGMLDEVFGPGAFKNEIVWHYYNKMQGNINRFASDHDTILVYSKSDSFTFNKLREKRDKPVQQMQRVWDKTTQSLMNAKDSDGHVLYITATHKTIDDVWRMPMLQPADRSELVGYPTQKPEALLERIILAFSKPGDIVFDCFMGSGTTQIVAAKYGRRFVGSDINLGAIQTTTKRLLGVVEEISQANYKPTIKNGLLEELGEAREDEDEPESKGWTEALKVSEWYRGFAVYNVNQYDVFRNELEAKELLIQALEIQPLPGNSLYDGEKDGRMVKVMPVNRIATKDDLNTLIANFDYKEFAKREGKSPNKPVENLLIVCMGHEPDLKATLQAGVPHKLDIEIVDILRDKQDLQFKREAEAKVMKVKGELVIEQFYPMNLLQKLSMQKETVEDWRELVESVMVDWNYDGGVFEPTLVDVPDKNELVRGTYPIPKDAGTIKVKITDLLSESLEIELR